MIYSIRGWMASNVFVSPLLFHLPVFGLCSSQLGWEEERWRLRMLHVWNGPMEAGRKWQDSSLPPIQGEFVGVAVPETQLYLLVTESYCCCWRCGTLPEDVTWKTPCFESSIGETSLDPGYETGSWQVWAVVLHEQGWPGVPVSMSEQGLECCHCTCVCTRSLGNEDVDALPKGEMWGPHGMAARVMGWIWSHQWWDALLGQSLCWLVLWTPCMWGMRRMWGPLMPQNWASQVGKSVLLPQVLLWVCCKWLGVRVLLPFACELFDSLDDPLEQGWLTGGEWEVSINMCRSQVSDIWLNCLGLQPFRPSEPSDPSGFQNCGCMMMKSVYDFWPVLYVDQVDDVRPCHKKNSMWGKRWEYVWYHACGGEVSRAFFVDGVRSKTCEYIGNGRQSQQLSFHQMISKKVNKRTPAALLA